MNGLILAGGKSSRMGSDKSLLNYHGSPQYLHIEKLMAPFCDHVLLSSNTSHETEIISLADDEQYKGIGPMAGLLSAYKYKSTDWLVIAIDYPLFTKDNLLEILRSKGELASVCYNVKKSLWEPYLGWYSQKFLDVLLNHFKQGEYALQKILGMYPIEKVVPSRIESIVNVNTVEDYQLLKDKLTCQ